MDYKDYTIQNNAENYFWYQARKSLINNLFSSVFKNQNQKQSILEIGCGTGYQLPVLEKWGTVQGLDINSKAVEIANNNGFNVKVANVEISDIGQNQFETICLFDVLEHIKNDNDLIKKIYLSLKSNGYLFLTVPAYNFMFSDHDRALDHFRRYDQKEMITMLEKNGFKVIKKGYWNFFIFPGVLLIRLLKNFIYLFIKKPSYQSEASSISLWLNTCLYKILMFENCLIKNNIKLGWGLSIFVIAKKS